MKPSDVALAPDTRLAAHKEAGRFLLDRAEQYDQSSGIYDALVQVGAALILGEAIERADRGELDDNDLLDWQKQIERGARKR